VTSGARTPEELDELLEDACVLRDAAALGALFDDGAVMVASGGGAARRALASLWAGGHTYVAHPPRVLEAGDVALVLGAAGLHVLRRGTDGTWRAAISLLDLEPTGQESPMSQDTQSLEPIATPAGAGEARWWLGALAEIKITAAQTGGLLSVLEITEPPDENGPLHVHHREDEAFWILEGDATFEVGDATIEAHAGDFVFGPRGIPHRYSTGPAGCRMLFVMTPGGFEELVRGMSVPAAARTLPPPPEGEPDWEHVAAVAEANGCELLA
jgi:mannose-6-phosphate isomerase-like protein (cupin superfamily)